MPWQKRNPDLWTLHFLQGQHLGAEGGRMHAHHRVHGLWLFEGSQSHQKIIKNLILHRYITEFLCIGNRSRRLGHLGLLHRPHVQKGADFLRPKNARRSFRDLPHSDGTRLWRRHQENPHANGERVEIFFLQILSPTILWSFCLSICPSLKSLGQGEPGLA